MSVATLPAPTPGLDKFVDQFAQVAATSDRTVLKKFVADLAKSLGVKTLVDATEQPRHQADDTAERLLTAVASGLDPPALLDADAAARLLGCSRASLYRSVAAGTIPPAVASPGGPRWKRAELLKAIERMRPA